MPKGAMRVGLEPRGIWERGVSQESNRLEERVRTSRGESTSGRESRLGVQN